MYYIAKNVAQDKRDHRETGKSRVGRSKPGSRVAGLPKRSKARNAELEWERQHRTDLQLQSNNNMQLQLSGLSASSQGPASHPAQPKRQTSQSQVARVKHRIEKLRTERPKVNLAFLCSALLFSSGATVTAIGYLDYQRPEQRRKPLQTIGIVLLIGGLFMSLTGVIYHVYLVLALLSERKMCRQLNVAEEREMQEKKQQQQQQTRSNSETHTQHQFRPPCQNAAGATAAARDGCECDSGSDSSCCSDGAAGGSRGARSKWQRVRILMVDGVPAEAAQGHSEQHDNTSGYTLGHSERYEHTRRDAELGGGGWQQQPRGHHHRGGSGVPSFPRTSSSPAAVHTAHPPLPLQRLVTDVL